MNRVSETSSRVADTTSLTRYAEIPVQSESQPDFVVLFDASPSADYRVIVPADRAGYNLFPETLGLESLGTNNPPLRKRLYVMLLNHGRYWSASDGLIHRYGTGITVGDAIADYKADVSSYFSELLAGEGRLSMSLAQDLRILREYITDCPSMQ